MLLTLVLGTLLARGVTKRISRLARRINLVAEGDLDVRVPVTGSDELTELARVFNRMLGEMEQSRARIEYLQRIGAWQEMAQRLAHEIKNPLTPIQLAVQECHRKYARRGPAFRALLDTTLEIVEEEVGTLRRLVGNFSSFARLPHAELHDASLERVPARVLGAARAPRGARRSGGAPTDAVLGARTSRCAGRSRASRSRSAIDRQMLRRVLVNLVRNAVQAIRGARAGRARPRSQVIGPRRAWARGATGTGVAHGGRRRRPRRRRGDARAHLRAVLHDQEPRGRGSGSPS